MAPLLTADAPTPRPVKPRWTAADIPSLAGRVAIVTGASSGIGLEIARGLASRGAHVIVASRDEARTKAAAEQLRRAHAGTSIDGRALDLARFASIREFVASIARAHAGVDILVNNAGVAGGPRRLTADGFEVHLQVNHLGHFALAGLLWPLLRARPGARVVSVASEVASRAKIDFDDINAERAYSFVNAYAQSKLANLLFARELDRRSHEVGAGVESFACHPGVANSNLFVGKEQDWGRPPKGMEIAVRLVQRLFAQPAATSALPALYQATDPSAVPGRYVGPAGMIHGRGHPSSCKLPSAAVDLEAGRRLWELSAQMCGVSYDGLDSSRAKNDGAFSVRTG